jgi:tetratricopeptide (TPR) repeat protein
LGDDEQRLFNRLGVFSGGCRLDAAEAVADADIDTLQSLVDKSLVRHSGDRYWMLETIREYSTQFVDDELRRRHADHFLDLADEPFTKLLGDPGDWLSRLDLERANFRSALEWLTSANDTQRALQLVGALGRFWYQRGDTGEGVRALEDALAADAEPTPARARALLAAAVLLQPRRELTLAASRATEALELSRQLDDGWGVAYSTFLLGHMAMDRREWAAACELLLDSIERFETLGADHFWLVAKINLAWSYKQLGDTERDRALIEEVHRDTVELRNKRMLTSALGAKAAHAQEDGRSDEALELLRQGYAVIEETGAFVEVPDFLGRMASVLAATGRHEAAARLLAKATELHKQTGSGQEPWIADRNGATLAAISANLDQAAFERAWNEGLALSEDEAVAETL